MGDRLTLEVVRHVTILLAVLATTHIVHRRAIDSLPCALGVDALDILGYGIRHGDDTWRAYHTAVIPAPQVPDGQEALLLVDVNHGVGNIVHKLGVGDGH